MCVCFITRNIYARTGGDNRYSREKYRVYVVMHTCKVKSYNIYIIKCEFYTLIYVRASQSRNDLFLHTHTLSIFLTFSCSSPIFFFTLFTIIICIIIVHRLIAVNISNNTFFL